MGCILGDKWRTGCPKVNPYSHLYTASLRVKTCQIVYRIDNLEQSQPEPHKAALTSSFPAGKNCFLRMSDVVNGSVFTLYLGRPVYGRASGKFRERSRLGAHFCSYSGLYPAK